jgi:hypothetical protein
MRTGKSTGGDGADGETAASNQSDMAATPGKHEPKKKGKGPWKMDTEEKLEQAIEIGVRSSGKAETRVHRVEFYLEQLARAKVQVAFYEEMLRLEELKDSVVVKRTSKPAAELDEEIEQLTLWGQVEGEDDDRTVGSDLCGQGVDKQRRR